MQKYHIKSEFPALIESDGQCFELSIGTYLVADENEKIKVYPITSHRECYNLCYLISLNEQSLAEFKTIKFPTYTELHLKERLIARSSVPLVEKKDNQIKCSLSSFPHTFFIETSDQTYQYNIPYCLSGSEIKIDANNIKLIASTEKNDYLLLFNRRKCEFCEIYAEKILIKDNNIKIKQIKNNIAKHAIEREIELMQDGQNELSRTLYYINKKPNLAKNDKIIPLAFLEAVEVQDYNLAKSYLSDILKTKLSENHLKSFFGNIQEITYYQDYIAVVNGDNKIKLFNFKIQNHKIENISEID